MSFTNRQKRYRRIKDQLLKIAMFLLFYFPTEAIMKIADKLRYNVA